MLYEVNYLWSKFMNCSLPDGFNYLKQDDTNIKIWLRYSTETNFVGKTIDGYFANNVLVMTNEAIEAIEKVNKLANHDGFNLVVYDAYRPVKAVENFVRWANDPNDIKNKQIYYPDVLKKDIIPDGYVSNASQHCHGSTIDLTLIRNDTDLNTNPILKHRVLESGRVVPYYDDNSLDMFTSFDLFDNSSWPSNIQIPKENFDMREVLKIYMGKFNFKPITTEWWHFTLENQPFPDKSFDFDICENY